MSKTLIVQIPDVTFDALRAERLLTGVPTSVFVRRAVTARLAAKDGKPYVHAVTGESFTADEVEAIAEKERLGERI
jgi:hypothetical protein